MAGTGVWVRLLERHRVRLAKDPDMNKVFTKLIKRGIFSIPEERHLLSAVDVSERTDILIDKLSKDPDAFRNFCITLEECAPHLLTELLLDRGDVFSTNEDHDTRALQFGFELALKERDIAMQDQNRIVEDLAEARRRLEVLQSERDRAVNSLENLSARLNKPANPKRFDGSAYKVSSSSLQLNSEDTDDITVEEESGDNVVWHIHRVSLQRVANYGFGIAVSGGHDSPHFASGDPSIAVSDVLKAGPAEGKLQLNDRIISVNGISLENVSHATAIQVLKNCGENVQLVVRRRVVMPAVVEKESPPLKVTLSKKNKKDEFGVVLGCRFYIRDLTPDSLGAQDGGLKVGDTVLKINNTPLEGLSLVDVKKLLEKSKDRLQLIVSKAQIREHGRPHQNAQQVDEGYATFRSQPPDKNDVNVYRPSVRSEEDLYPNELPPVGAYPVSGQPGYSGRYIYEHEAPPRPPLPSGFDRDGPHSPNREPPRGDDFYPPTRLDRDGYFSDHEIDGRVQREDDDNFTRQFHDERYIGMPSNVRGEIRRVVFQKDKQKGLGLRLAGGNATGIFIASVQPGSSAEAEGLVEGDQILQANGLDIVGLTREDAVAHLTSLEGQVTLVVQYKKEDYDGIMASHEAGDSFYIRTHFNYDANEASGDHTFKVGDIFHVKDTLFRGVGGSWLAIRVGPTGEELKKGTIPNKKKAELIVESQQLNAAEKEAFPNKGKGSLFKRKSTRRTKSLGKDHWEEVIFSEEGSAAPATKFPPYERVVLRDPAFVRPVVLFGAIDDIARERLLSEFPDKFESPQVDKGTESDPKKKSGIIRFGAIREAMSRQKHCVLDVTPYHVDRLNYAQYYPIVIFLRSESKQAIKEVRSRSRGGSSTSKNPKKLQEHNERIASLYSHLITGTIIHNNTDIWFPKLMEMIESQQRRPVWMSEKKPEEDMNDDFMFPMPNRLSLAGGTENEPEFVRSSDDLDASPIHKKRLMRSSSDPSINTMDRIPGIPPYPAPPRYHDAKSPPHRSREESYWDDYRLPRNQKPPDRDGIGDWQMNPDDRFYPHSHHLTDSTRPTHLPQQQPPFTHHNRSAIDVYATMTPSERLRNRVPGEYYIGSYDDYSLPRDRISSDEGFRTHVAKKIHLPQEVHGGSTQSANPDQKGYNDSSSHDSDSYSRYVSNPSNKHDDSKLRDKFGALQVGGRTDRSTGGHDPYRFTRSTANPVSNAQIDRAKLSDLTAKYRKDDKQRSSIAKPSGPTSHSSDRGSGERPTARKRDPPPVPVKTYSLKEIDMDHVKARNYENSNRSYNYSEINFSRQQQPYAEDSRLLQDQQLQFSHQISAESPYEYISSRSKANASSRDMRLQDVPPPLPPLPSENYRDNLIGDRGSFDEVSPRAFSNNEYMDHQEVDRLRSRNSGAEREMHRHDQTAYTRPRTDDEQLRELQQRSRNKVKQEHHPVDRTKSETRLNSRGDARWNKYKSWDNEKEGQRTFDTYKKLITPGFYGARRQMSKSHDELREESLPANMQPLSATSAHNGERSSAFEAYKKRSTAENTSAARKVEDHHLSREPLISIAPSFPPPPPPVSLTYCHLSYSSQNLSPLPPPPSPPSPLFTSSSHRRNNSFQALEVQNSLPCKSILTQNHAEAAVFTTPDLLPSMNVVSPLSPPLMPATHSSDSDTSAPTPVPLQPAISVCKKYDSNSNPCQPQPPLLSSLLPPVTAGPISMATKHSLLSSPPCTSAPDTHKSQSPLKSFKFPPPPPPLIVTPLPPVDMGQKGDNHLSSGGISTGQRRMSGERKKSAPEDDDSDSSTSESVSTPETVVPGPGQGQGQEEGQTVVATARGVFTSAGGVLESKETGVSIVIPAGALPEGSEQEIYFKVCSGNSILPPLDEDRGETLLSPLVMCGPHGLRFKKPVELKLPHSASVNPESWSFALKSSDSPSGQPTQWQNMNLAGSEGVTQGRVSQSSVSVLVDHF